MHRVARDERRHSRSNDRTRQIREPGKGRDIRPRIPSDVEPEEGRNNPFEHVQRLGMDIAPGKSPLVLVRRGTANRKPCASAGHH